MPPVPSTWICRAFRASCPAKRGFETSLYNRSSAVDGRGEHFVTPGSRKVFSETHSTSSSHQGGASDSRHSSRASCGRRLTVGSCSSCGQRQPGIFAFAQQILRYDEGLRIGLTLF
ncbi:hypothetical protein HPB52_009270 [Rhipicephalus sanguineus]|uniref:Uncharacterized protein n=1 Tax=Rhipicephalus sanguineus TaxID=34632 RepID=A0A9D4T939_RHISA|nr:hypothetical protein HPB52_009270 [Rhipicephalus sanguineus]